MLMCKMFDGMVANPFQLAKLVAINDTENIFHPSVYQGVCKLEAIGEKQLQEFWNDRLIQGKVPINEKISKNNIVLPGNVKKYDGKMS